MAEILDLAHLPISDRAQLEEVDDDRDATLSASATLANESQDLTARCLDQLKRLLDEVDPPIAILLRECDALWESLEMLWEVRVRLPVPPEQLDLRIKSVRIGCAGQLTAHERIEGVSPQSDRVQVLRHRLAPLLGEAFGGSKGLGAVGEVFDLGDLTVSESEDLEDPPADLNATRHCVAAKPQ